jgi:hypothetical protein
MPPPERSAAVHPPTPMCQQVGLPSPEQLPEGAVLVVDSAQSGCQITEDLLGACRSGTGAQAVGLVVQAGLMDQRPHDLPYPSMMFAAMAIVARAAACTRHPPNPTTMTPRSTGPAEVAGPARRGHRQRGVVHRVGRRLLLARPTLVDADGQLRHEDADAVAPGRWSLGLR